MATTIIGKVMTDGQVRYIKCDDTKTEREHANILIRFYGSESRLDALLMLGNLEILGPSPYGRFHHSDGSPNCLSLMRDCHEMNNESQVLTDKAHFLNATLPAFLFENGRWYYLHDKHLISFNSADVLPEPEIAKNFNELTIFRHSRDIERMKNSQVTADFGSWAEMMAKVYDDDDTYFIFREAKLIQTINPKPLQKS